MISFDTPAMVSDNPSQMVPLSSARSPHHRNLFFAHPVNCPLAPLLAIVLLLATPALSAPAQENSLRPNVVLIVGDDQGSIDLNCYGAKDLATPNLDSLASRGVRFTQFYAGSSICSPARATILTGRYPQRAQLPGMAPSRRGRPGMPAGQLTIAELLKPAGYNTALFGKWHLGMTMQTGPNRQGFDEFVGFRCGCIDNYSHFFY